MMDQRHTMVKLQRSKIDITIFDYLIVRELLYSVSCQSIYTLINCVYLVKLYDNIMGCAHFLTTWLG